MTTLTFRAEHIAKFLDFLKKHPPTGAYIETPAWLVCTSTGIYLFPCSGITPELGSMFSLANHIVYAEGCSPSDDPENWMKEARGLNPSGERTHVETIPRILLEAMALDLPFATIMSLEITANQVIYTGFGRKMSS